MTNPPPHQSLTCFYCGRPIVTEAWLCRREPCGYWTYFHADTGPYGPNTYPTCSMAVAEVTALLARGWTMPPGCVTWMEAARSEEAKTLTEVTPRTDFPAETT